MFPGYVEFVPETDTPIALALPTLYPFSYGDGISGPFDDPIIVGNLSVSSGDFQFSISGGVDRIRDLYGFDLVATQLTTYGVWLVDWLDIPAVPGADLETGCMDSAPRVVFTEPLPPVIPFSDCDLPVVTALFTEVV